MIPTACIAETLPPRYVSTLVTNRVPSEIVASIYNPRGLSLQPTEVANRAEELQALIMSSSVAIGDPTRNISARLIEIRNDEDEDSPPTEYAVAQALHLTEDSAKLLAQKWRSPRVATDGYGGLRLSWRDGKRELRAVIAGNKDKERYLYWEDIGGYGSIPNFTATTLFTYLDRFTSSRALSGA
jgi:hypothetical protein